ncbi:MAG: proton-conducting membrane transporter [Clostridia bacterium]|nr:proton-conducting membrane transporter [Clostridia bacterium]
MILYTFMLIPAVAGLLIYLVPKRQMLWLAFGLQASLLVLSAYNFVFIINNGPIEIVLGNFTKVAGISLRCDTLAAAMIMLASFIFMVCFLFGLLDKFMNNLFIFFFLVLQALVMTIFLSRDLFNLYVVTEVSTIVVSVLIMFKKDSRSLYDGMLYLITNIAAMTFFLFGLAFVYRIFGTLDMDLIGAKMHLVEDAGSLAVPFGFLMTGVGLKCAFLPLFSWLPNAHATPSAPSIVSVILSGLYVKCGIYMFIRIREMFLPALIADDLFLIIGIATGILGFMLAIGQKDIKMMLAYSTISQIGLILMGIASGGQTSYYGGVLHVLNHAVFKSLLFLFAGILISKYQTRDMTKIRGVFKSMPYVSIMAFAAMLGITGAPLFNGSISKYLIESNFKGSIAEYAVIFINLGTIIYFIKFSQIFRGGSPHGRVSVDIWKKAAVTIMGILCLLMGLTGTVVISNVFHYRVSLDFWGYVKNTAMFFASAAIGLLLYGRFFRKLEIINKGFSLELGVNGIGISMTLFFIFMTSAAYVIARV